jgi:hypothetical protein
MQKGGQALSERVDEQVCHVLRAGTHLEDGKNLGAAINRQPQPGHLFGAAGPGAQFVQLQVRQVEMAEEALVEGVRVPYPGYLGHPFANEPFGLARFPSFFTLPL